MSGVTGPPPRDEVAAWLAPHGESLAAVAERCRRVANDRLGVALPALGITVDFVAPTEQQVHHDGHAGVRVAVSGPTAFDPPPAGANLRYAVCHEVGHLTVIHARADRRSPGVVWDEALAHLLALDAFLPDVPDSLAAPDAPPDWRAVEIAVGEADTADGTTASLRRCTAQLRARADAGGGLAALLAAVARVPGADLRADRFLHALDRTTAR